MAFRNALGEALFYAVYNNMYDTAKYILESNFNVNIGYYDTNNGNGLLHIAIKHDNYKMIELLLKHGADLTYENKDELTPIVYAANLKKCIGLCVM